MGEWRYTSCIINIDPAWRCAVSFTRRPLYPRVKIIRHPSKRKLNESHCVWTIYRRHKPLAPPGYRNTIVQIAQPVFLSLYWLSYPRPSRDREGCFCSKVKARLYIDGNSFWWVRGQFLKFNIVMWFQFHFLKNVTERAVMSSRNVIRLWEPNPYTRMCCNWLSWQPIETVASQREDNSTDCCENMNMVRASNMSELNPQLWG